MLINFVVLGAFELILNFFVCLRACLVMQCPYQPVILKGPSQPGNPTKVLLQWKHQCMCQGGADIVVLPCVTVSQSNLAPGPKLIVKWQRIIIFFWDNHHSTLSGSEVYVCNNMGSSQLIDRRGFWTEPAKRGFKFCQKTNCRYWLKIKFAGSRKAELQAKCIKNVSSKSSNLKYSITCTR